VNVACEFGVDVFYNSLLIYLQLCYAKQQRRLLHFKSPMSPIFSPMLLKNQPILLNKQPVLLKKQQKLVVLRHILVKKTFFSKVF